jgi:predicted nucleic acid-binding protein
VPSATPAKPQNSEATPIVLDASATITLLMPPRGPLGLVQLIFTPDHSLHAPHLLDIEVTQTIRRFAASGAIDEALASAALTNLADLPINRYDHLALLPRIWALRHNLSAYDATYVALAELLGATLITRDKRLANAAGMRARVEIV